MKKALAGVWLTLLMLLAACGQDAAPTIAPVPQADHVGAAVVISQVYGGGGNSGAPLQNDFVELFNRSDTSQSLAELSLQYTSATGTGNFGANTGLRVSLPEATLEPGEYFLVQLAGGANGSPLPAPDATGTINMAAASGKVALATGTTSLGCNGGSSPCTPEQLERIIDLVGFGSANFFEGDAATPTLNNTLAALRDGDGCTDTDQNAQDFTTGTPDPRNSASPLAPCDGSGGGDNGGGDDGETPPTTPGVCGDEATLISTVQGSGAASPIVGQNVTVEAVVVGDFQSGSGALGDLNGFYIQEEDADQDGDPATSEGLFVFAPDAQAVSEGELVRVTGTVSEFITSNGASSLTQLSDLTNLTVCGTAALPTPVDITLPLASPDALEPLEGMLVRLPQELVISEYFNFDRFGEITLALPQTSLGAEVDRLYTPTSYVLPGEQANAEAAENALRRITLDDGRTSQNPDPARHPNGEAFTLENRFRGGDTVQNVVGVVDERFGLYRIQPTQGAEYTATNPRPAAPEAVGGSLEVASFNVLNYFTDLNRRGATTTEEFERQAAKIVAALEVIGADVVGLIEIQNNGEVAVGDLVNRLNAAVGAGTYAFINTGMIGTDEITNALIYKPSTVTPVGDFALLDSSDDPRFLDTKNRPVLIQTFDENATGGRLTVAVNHFKSKGSSCNDVGDPDRNDGQANCNGTRTQAAQALADYLATDPTGSGDPDTLIIGDLNAYDKEDPIRALESAGYTDLIRQFQGEFSYTYVFDGQFGYLDYALANGTLLSQVTGTTAWAINADEPDILDYTTQFKQPAQRALFEPNAFRSSDHDPVIVGLSLTGVTEPEPEPTPEEALADLKAEVQALSGTLNPGQLRSLQAQLDTASRQLERGQTQQVVHSLERFEDGVRRFIRQGALTEAQGQPLIDASSALRNRF